MLTCRADRIIPCQPTGQRCGKLSVHFHCTSTRARIVSVHYLVLILKTAKASFPLDHASAEFGVQWIESPDFIEYLLNERTKLCLDQYQAAT